MNESKTFPRFNLAQRVEHIILIVSFTTLCLTGLPQKYAGQGWAESLIALMGGIETVRIIHRVAATVFILQTVYHVVVLVYKLFVLRLQASIMPSIQDARDGIQALLFNLGLAKRRPNMGRYTFDEKLEYWAMIWGTLVMVLTGFMLWNPIATAGILPGQFIPAAKSAHGGEALLAFLGILIWHTYHVHLRHFNRSIWTGKLSRNEMLHEHPLELQAIESGKAAPAATGKDLSKRKRVFYPVAGAVTALLLGATFFFVTFEQTALTTVPPAETALVFSPQTPTPIPTAEPKPTAVPKPTEAPNSSAAPAQPGAALTWDNSVGATFQAKCESCHGALGGLSTKSYADVMKGSAKGAVIVPGNPDGSSLVILQSGGNHPGLFTADELAQIKAWIAAGAPEK